MAYANYSPRVSTGILTASRSGQCPNRRPACPMARPTTLHGAGTAHTSRSSSAWTAVPPTIPMPGTMVVSRLRRPGTRVMRSCSERLRQSRLGHRQTRNTGKLRSLRECSQLVASYRGGYRDQSPQDDARWCQHVSQLLQQEACESENTEAFSCDRRCNIAGARRIRYGGSGVPAGSSRLRRGSEQLACSSAVSGRRRSRAGAPDGFHRDSSRGRLHTIRRRRRHARDVRGCFRARLVVSGDVPQCEDHGENRAAGVLLERCLVQQRQRRIEKCLSWRRLGQPG